ncbi:hypothetical protein [Nocardia sp. SYP-A9097]|uniref:hypothetical protein n=1 Tax=Nocardia sp. SYP-A9097 TaxID=2663237 RepID=UPI001E2C5950|nr:hypothetical protein [Nocardia sp. SYP-A9097]
MATPLPGLRRRWSGAVTLGEFLGFGAPACAGAFVAHAGAVATIVLVPAAGTVEGSVLVLFQARVLRTGLSRLRIRDWMAATGAGTIVAWSVGMLPMLLGDRFTGWPVWVRISETGTSH